MKKAFHTMFTTLLIAVMILNVIAGEVHADIDKNKTRTTIQENNTQNIPNVSEENPAESKSRPLSSPSTIETPADPDTKIEEALTLFAETEVSEQLDEDVAENINETAQERYEDWSVYDLITVTVTVLSGLIMIISI